MSAAPGPFDPGPGPERPTHLVLENAAGLRSLWPAWRERPAGWAVRFGPAPQQECARWTDSGSART